MLKISRQQIAAYVSVPISGGSSDEHADGVVYFNPNIPTKIYQDSMEFSGWYPFYRDDDVNAELSAFVNQLGSRWLKFHGSHIGETNPILELETFAEMTAVLDGR